MKDQPRQEQPEIVPATEPAEAELACELCRCVWPADALENGVCPDCLDAAEESA